MVKAMKKYSRYALVFVFLILMWLLASLAVKLPIIPSPLRVMATLIEIFPKKMAIHSLYSLYRIFAGILVSMIIGIPLGLSMGYFKGIDDLLSPMVYFLYPIPKIALIPIVMLLLGLGDGAKIFMIMLIIVFQIIVAARDAVKDISRETYHSFYSLGAGKWSIFKHIILPASLPGLLTSIRISLGTAISVLFFTETFGTQYGMGYFIMDAWMRVNYLEMYAGIVMLSLIGGALFFVVDMMEKKLCRWR
jgi:NitT/TauT family transport system permease protein